MNRRPGYRYSKLLVKQSITLTALTTVFRTEYDGHERESDSNDFASYYNIDRSNITDDASFSEKKSEEIDECESSRAENVSHINESIAQGDKYESRQSATGYDEQRSKNNCNDQCYVSFASDSADADRDTGSPVTDNIYETERFESPDVDRSVLSSKPRTLSTESGSESQMRRDKDSDSIACNGEDEIKDRLYFASKGSRRLERELIDVTEIADDIKSGSIRCDVSKMASKSTSVEYQNDDTPYSQSYRRSASSFSESATAADDWNENFDGYDSFNSEMSLSGLDHLDDVCEVFDCSESGLDTTVYDSRSVGHGETKETFENSVSDDKSHEDYTTHDNNKRPFRNTRIHNSYEQAVGFAERTIKGCRGDTTFGDHIALGHEDFEVAPTSSNNGRRGSCNQVYQVDADLKASDTKEITFVGSETHQCNELHTIFVSDTTDRDGYCQDHGSLSTVPITGPIGSQTQNIPPSSPGGRDPQFNESVGDGGPEEYFDSKMYKCDSNFVHIAENDTEDRCIAVNVSQNGKNEVSSALSGKWSISDTDGGGEQIGVNHRVRFDSDSNSCRERNITTLSKLPDSISTSSDGLDVETTVPDHWNSDNIKNEVSSSESDGGSLNSCENDDDADAALDRKGERNCAKNRLNFDFKMDIYTDVDIAQSLTSCAENEPHTALCVHEANAGVHDDDFSETDLQGRDTDSGIVTTRDGVYDHENQEELLNGNSWQSQGYWISNDSNYWRAESLVDKYENPSEPTSDECDRDALREGKLQQACECFDGSHCFYSYYSDGVESVDSPQISDSSNYTNNDDKHLAFGTNSDLNIAWDFEEEHIRLQNGYRKYRMYKNSTATLPEHNSEAPVSEVNCDRRLEEDNGPEGESHVDGVISSDEEIDCSVLYESCACCANSVRIITEYGGYWEANVYKCFTPTGSDDDDSDISEDDTYDTVSVSEKYFHAYDSDDDSDIHEAKSNLILSDDDCESEEEYVKCRNEYRSNWESDMVRNNSLTSSRDDCSEESFRSESDRDEENEDGEQKHDRDVDRPSNQHYMHDKTFSEHDLRVACCDDGGLHSKDEVNNRSRDEATNRPESVSQVSNVVYISDDNKEKQYNFSHFSGKIVFSSCSFRSTVFNFHY